MTDETEAWRKEAQHHADRSAALADAFRTYVEAHEYHRSWCNGGYEHGSCTCDLEERIAMVLDVESHDGFS